MQRIWIDESAENCKRLAELSSEIETVRQSLDALADTVPTAQETKKLFEKLLVDDQEPRLRVQERDYVTQLEGYPSRGAFTRRNALPSRLPFISPFMWSEWFELKVPLASYLSGWAQAAVPKTTKRVSLKSYNAQRSTLTEKLNSLLVRHEMEALIIERESDSFVERIHLENESGVLLDAYLAA